MTLKCVLVLLLHWINLKQNSVLDETDETAEG